jgi:hypothetical protein
MPSLKSSSEIGARFCAANMHVISALSSMAIFLLCIDGSFFYESKIVILHLQNLAKNYIFLVFQL